MGVEGECAECLGRALVSGPRTAIWSALHAAKGPSRGSSKGTPRSSTKKHQPQYKAPANKPPSYWKPLVWGVICAIFGLMCLFVTPFEFLMSERLEMRHHLPPYEWWANPPDEVLLSVYLFNITNSEEFTSGEEDILRLQEIGPIVYREKLTHSDIVFNSNGTLSYTATRRAIFLPELNNVNLNDSITVANLAVLGMSSFLWDAPWAMKIGFNMMIRSQKSKPFKTMSIYDYLWDYKDPVVPLAKALAPSLVPTENLGVLFQIYENFKDRVTVYMGTKWGDSKYFQIEKFNGDPGMAKWENKTCDSVEGSTEGVLYHQRITRNDTVRYLRKTFCRAANLYYTGDHNMLDMTVYKFELPNDTFDRPPNGEEDCYLTPGLPSLFSGLTDASPCYYNFPIATSFPHLMHADPKATDRFVGLTPDHEKHGSFVYVEPITGIPLRSAARSQSNLVVRPFKSGFSELRRFRNLSIPMFWAEYKQVDLPFGVKVLLQFTVKILPVWQYVFIFAVFVCSIILCFSAQRRWRVRLKYYRKDYCTVSKSEEAAKLRTEELSATTC